MEKQKIWLVRAVEFYTTARNSFDVYDKWSEIDEQEHYDCIDCDKDAWFEVESEARAFFEVATQRLKDTGDDDDEWHTYNGVVLGYADADKDDIWNDDTWEEVDVEFAYYCGKTGYEY